MERKGFTLIELLVVIAIISILAGIMFPVFAKSRDTARETVCLSNIRQIGTALRLYADDYDNQLPWCNDTTVINAQTGDFFTWEDIIKPFLKSAKILVCPGSSFPSTSSDSGHQLKIGHYGCNRLIMKPAVAYIEMNIARPAETYLIMDSGSYVIQPNYIVDPSYNPHSGWFRYLPGSASYIGKTSILNDSGTDQVWTALNGLAKGDLINGRHNGGIVMGFCDGHAKRLPVSEVCQQAQLYMKETDNMSVVTSTSSSTWSALPNALNAK
jgi:prepilin-type N-terminal cleavage/methylation domain-containing protein/prepilin-type processing-associated H-X9-DG protein